jgi:hypothetical protein
MACNVNALSPGDAPRAASRNPQASPQELCALVNHDDAGEACGEQKSLRFILSQHTNADLLSSRGGRSTETRRSGCLRQTSNDRDADDDGW